jgi:cell division protein FtsL
MVLFLKNLFNICKPLLITYLIIVAVLAIFIPKIYVRNNIYFTSKDIDELYTEYLLLKEENNVLKAKLESLRFHNQIDDILLYKRIDN